MEKLSINEDIIVRKLKNLQQHSILFSKRPKA